MLGRNEYTKKAVTPAYFFRFKALKRTSVGFCSKFHVISAIYVEWCKWVSRLKTTFSVFAEI